MNPAPKWEAARAINLEMKRDLLSTLKHWPHQRGEHSAAEVRERLSLLDASQRAAGASVLLPQDGPERRSGLRTSPAASRAPGCGSFAA